jgi:predicted acylesterase/phospholipase RssA
MAKVVGIAGRGAVIGELGVVADSVRSASVRALRDSETVEVTRESFMEALRRHPAVAEALIRLLAVKLVRTDTLKPLEQPRPRTVAFVGLADDLPFDEAAADLGRALRRFSTAVALHRDTDAPVEQWGPLLDRLERSNDYVVLPSTQTSGVWFEFCIRQADHVVVLARSSSPLPEGGARKSLQGCDLLFVDSPPGDKIINALEPRVHEWPPIGSHGAPVVERLARRLVGRSNGVVLSGGGARGLAHIGVLQVFAERGVVIDRVGGCSVGALIAAMFATGRHPEEMARLLRDELVRRNPFTDFTLPRVALLRGRRFEMMLARLFGSVRLEDLLVDCFCVSADLVSTELFIHRRGEVRRAVAATMAVPGLTPPVALDGRLLVDGGVLDNLPVAPMSVPAEGPVIAVDVMRRVAVSERTVGPLSLMETLLRATVLGSRRTSASALEQATVVISPQVQDIGLRDFRQLDRAIEAGRRAALVALDEHPDLISA